MSLEKLLLFLLSQGFNMMAFLLMLLATTSWFSRLFFSFWAAVAITFTLMQRGCTNSLHEIGAATGGGGAGPDLPLVGIEFGLIVLWTVALYAFNVRLRRNLPNSLR